MMASKGFPHNCPFVMENPTVADRLLSQTADNAGDNVFFVFNLNKLSTNRIEAKQS